MKIEEFNKLDFDMILMSPPCQPFTRQGNQEGVDDRRSQSFLKLLSIIPECVLYLYELKPL
jgi:tRNA (cytosine38-C5)-methyltransferase